jgi:hypothetical protein
MQTLRRSCCLHSCWILIIDVSESPLQKYHLVDELDDSESSLESSFPHAIIERMPPYMSNVLAALKNKSILCSFCADTLLNYIGRLANDNCYSHLSALYVSEESFIDECIEVVCCGYIYRIMEHCENRQSLSSEVYINILHSCKIAARTKRKKRLRDEFFLGNASFANELHRSFNEFVAIIVSALGYVPVRVQIMEELR